MPVEDNKQAVRRFYDDVVNGRNLDAVDELLTPDGVDDTFGSQSDVAVPAPPEDADGQGLRRLVMLTLGVQRIGSDHGVGEVQLLQQRPEPGDLVGRAVDVGLGQDPGVVWSIAASRCTCTAPWWPLPRRVLLSTSIPCRHAARIVGGGWVAGGVAAGRPPPPHAAGGHPRLQRLLHPGDAVRTARRSNADPCPV
jgi:hypothetical protein